MSNLSIGLVSSEDQESKTLVTLLQEQNIDVIYHLSPEDILIEHTESKDINVWLLSVDDDHWHDNIDTLLDESDASIYFNEPGSLSKEEHPEYWCRNLVSRLYEVSGLENQIAGNQLPDKHLPLTESVNSLSKSAESNLDKPDLNKLETVEFDTVESDASISILDSALDELYTTSVGLPSDVAAELVSELEDISPQLNPLSGSVIIDHESIDITSVEKIDLSNDVTFEDIDLTEKELLTEETFDFLDAAIISHEKSNLEKNDVIEDIQVVEGIEAQDVLEKEISYSDNQEKIKLDFNKPQISLSKDNDFDTIDFSSLAMPILESARDDDLVSVQSEYSLEEDEPESSGDEIALATTKEYDDAHELKLKEHQNLEAPIADLGSDLSVENLGSGVKTIEEALQEQEKEESFDEEIEGLNIDFSLEDNEPVPAQGRAEFIVEEDELISEELNDDEKISLIDEKLELTGLSLENGKEVVFERANFLEDEEKEHTLENDVSSIEYEQTQSSLTAVNNQLGGLSLESKEEIITGRAVFIEEELEDDAPSSKENAHDKLLSNALGNIELALEGDSQITEKASFDIDETVIEYESPHDITRESGKIEPSRNLEKSSNLVKEIDVDLDNFDDISSEVIEDIETEAELVFEIPMLEDTATDIDFNLDVEELIAPTLTPCWIIGASLGGPAAVKRFIQNIPANINASFIVVQHIDENFLPVLADILTSSSHFEVKVASGSNSLTPGSVFLAPLKGKLTFLRDGSMLVDHSQSWSVPYSPCIDDVIESISSVYADKCGAIIFSGMGQDGYQGAKKLNEVQGEVWAQSVETCANASMPQAIINAGLAKVVATPEMLADRLVKKLGSI